MTRSRIVVAVLVALILASIPVSAEHRTLDDRREYFAEDVVVLVVQPSERAVHPNATVETTVVAHNLLSAEAEVNGTLLVRSHGASGSVEDNLLEIDRTLPAGGSANWTVSVDIDRPGKRIFDFLDRAGQGGLPGEEDEARVEVRTFTEPIVGLAPVAVDLLDRDRADPLVAVPGETTTFRFRVATVGDATVTNLTLAIDQAGVDVNETIAELGPDASTTIELPVTWPTEPEDRFQEEPERPIGPGGDGVRVGGGLSNLRPQVRGNSSIGPFDQALWDVEDDPPAPFGIGVHLVQRTGLQIVYGQAQRGEPVTLQVAAAAPATESLTVDAALRISLPGIPSTRKIRSLSLDVAPGDVRIEPVTWTPEGQGPYRMALQGPQELVRSVSFVQIAPGRSMGSTGGGGAATIRVDGPITFHQEEDEEPHRPGGSIAIPGGEGREIGPLQIGASTTHTVDITAREDTVIRRVGLTTTSSVGGSAFRRLRSDLPYEGPVSMADLVSVEQPGPIRLDAGERRNLTLDLTAHASGRYDLLPVLETSESLVVSSEATPLTVESRGSAVGMSLAPPIVVGVALVGHVVWRRRFVV